MKNKREIGSKKEALAMEYLKDQGVKIVCRNYRVRQGEIDLIGFEDKTLLFIEVKYRKNNKAGGALSAVTARKQKQIQKVSLYYLNQYKIASDRQIRYDVVAIDNTEITWVKNAFSFVL